MPWSGLCSRIYAKKMSYRFLTGPWCSYMFSRFPITRTYVQLSQEVSIFSGKNALVLTAKIMIMLNLYLISLFINGGLHFILLIDISLYNISLFTKRTGSICPWKSGAKWVFWLDADLIYTSLPHILRGSRGTKSPLFIANFSTVVVWTSKVFMSPALDFPSLSRVEFI